MPVINFSQQRATYRAGDALSSGQFEVARRAASAAGWSGVVLPAANVIGVTVFPVVELTGASQRLVDGVGPERCLTTLEMWETFGGVPAQHGGTPPAPLRVVGFVSVASRWDRALRDVQAVGGLGAGLVVRTRRPSVLQLMDADATDTWVVVDDGRDAQLCLAGRAGPVSTALRVPATRLIEEGLFAHALAHSDVAA